MMITVTDFQNTRRLSADTPAFRTATHHPGTVLQARGTGAARRPAIVGTPAPLAAFEPGAIVLVQHTAGYYGDWACVAIVTNPDYQPVDAPYPPAMDALARQRGIIAYD